MQQGTPIKDEPGPHPANWSPTASGIAVVAFIALLILAWTAASTLLLIFAGILLGVFLDGLTRLLGQAIGLGRGLRLTIVSLILGGLTLGFLAFGGATVVQQDGSSARPSRNRRGLSVTA